MNQIIRGTRNDLTSGPWFHPLVRHICQSSIDNSASLVSELASCSSIAVLCPRHFRGDLWGQSDLGPQMDGSFRRILCFCKYSYTTFHVNSDTSHTGRVQFGSSRKHGSNWATTTVTSVTKSSEFSGSHFIYPRVFKFSKANANGISIYCIPNFNSCRIG